MKLRRIEGIKSVDFKIKAKGFGVVNWNGSASIYSEQAGKSVKNHLLPKMRNFDMFKNKSFHTIDGQLYISQNCIKNGIFKDYAFALKSVTLLNVSEVLSSMVGLVRGFVIAEGSTSLKRKSPLFIEDFLATDDVHLNYEQFSQSMGRNETSIFSKHTTGETSYTAYGSINIEDLQFLPLEDSLGRSCFREVITEQDGRLLAEKINEFLKTLDFDGDKNPEAVFANNYKRVNSIAEEGEAGLLLNDDAIDLIVKELILTISTLYIARSRAYVKVDEFVVDYNDGSTIDAMRIKTDDQNISKTKERNYAVYYEASPLADVDFQKKENDADKLLKAKRKAK